MGEEYLECNLLGVVDEWVQRIIVYIIHVVYYWDNKRTYIVSNNDIFI